MDSVVSSSRPFTEEEVSKDVGSCLISGLGGSGGLEKVTDFERGWALGGSDFGFVFA